MTQGFWLVVDSAIAVLALLIGFFLHKWITDRRLGEAGVRAQRIVEEAERDAASRLKASELEVRESALKARAELDDHTRRREREIQQVEQRTVVKEEQLARKLEDIERRLAEFTSKDAVVARREKQVLEQEQRLGTLMDEQRRKLEAIAGLTAEEAKRQLLAQMEDEARREAALVGMRLEEEARETAQVKAREVLATSIQRLAADYTVETSVSVVDLPSDDMKGRIIGREGRNIRALEQHTGVDLIVDDTPEAVTLSGYDPVRREVARRALAKLIQDGRIHPARIEEVVNKTRLELEQVMREEGEKVAYEANVQGLHPDLIKLLGRMKFRTSYGQNVLQHSLEVSLIAGGLAAELGADVNVAKTAALLHDIGKAVDHEVDGPHALIGADIARRLGRSARIVHAIAAHHGEEEPQTVEAFIVATADAISGARPGARREMVETYIKRLEALEAVANSFDGVEKSFAIQAGREVRIMVSPDKIDDLAATKLARDIVKKIEENLEYPGQIKVTVIRETRAVDYAR
jgi:ribonuclease Y